MRAWIRGQAVPQETGRHNPYDDVRASRTKPAAPELAAALSVGRGGGEVSGGLKRLGGPGHRFDAAPGLVSQSGTVRLAPAVAGVHGGEKGGVGDMAGGRRESTILPDSDRQSGSGVSVNGHDLITARRRKAPPARSDSTEAVKNAQKESHGSK